MLVLNSERLNLGLSLNYIREWRRWATQIFANVILIWWLLCGRIEGTEGYTLSNDSSFAAMLHKRSPTRRWVLPLKFVPDRKVHKDTMFSASKSHFFEEMFIFHSKHLAGLLSDQLKSWNSLYAHLQEQSLGGEVSVSLALLWLVEAAHPTRLRCFLWASGGRSCHCAQVSRLHSCPFTPKTASAFN